LGLLERQQQVRQKLRQPDTQTLRAERDHTALRRNGVARVTPQAAAEGRFAARFHNREGGRTYVNESARQAWQHRRQARFVGWVGPVFWPYPYSERLIGRSGAGADELPEQFTHRTLPNLTHVKVVAISLPNGIQQLLNSKIQRKCSLTGT
jgi:hypothetical protein